jgi:pimeloyl-ACP methyl ester carboxylesterase
MHNIPRLLPHAILALVAVLTADQAAAGDEPESTGPSEVSEITLTAREGRIAWNDIIRALAATERFDAAALDDLPDGSLNLNSRGARLAILALDLTLPPECSVDILQHGDDTEPELRITLDRADMRERTRNYKRRIRERVGADAGAFGLKLDEDRSTAPGRPLVVLIHGYNATPDSLSTLHRRLRDDGWVCGVMSYPDDGPIDESAALLAEELGEFGRDHPDRNVAIVAHSMGGLVARAVIENPDLDPGNVRQLIMVGTPNQGSMLAHLPGGFDCIDHLREGDSDNHLFARAAADGFNEAAPDMRPDSAFLRRLNARDRNPRVKYSLLLGKGGPLSAAELDEFRSVIETAIERNRVLQFVSPRIEAPLADLDELLEGKGDGAVAVKRGRLEGVEDTQLLSFSHLTITKRADEPDADELFDAIITRLSGAADAD